MLSNLDVGKVITDHSIGDIATDATGYCWVIYQYISRKWIDITMKIRLGDFEGNLQ